MEPNKVSAEMREHYQRMIERAHDSTHYDGCWKDHWHCALEKALDELDRTQAEIQRLHGLIWKQQPGTRAKRRAHLQPSSVPAGDQS